MLPGSQFADTAVWGCQDLEYLTAWQASREFPLNFLSVLLAPSGRHSSFSPRLRSDVQLQLHCLRFISHDCTTRTHHEHDTQAPFESCTSDFCIPGLNGELGHDRISVQVGQQRVRFCLATASGWSRISATKTPTTGIACGGVRLDALRRGACPMRPG